MSPRIRSENYWNATSAKLRSLRECKRSIPEFELFRRLQPDLKMLADALPVEFAGHPGELDFTMERSIGHA